MRYAYPYVIMAEPEGGLFISFPDVPEVLTGADTRDDVERVARDALVAALSFYTDAGRPLPTPSRGRTVVPLPVVVALKLALHEAMLAKGVSNVALAGLLGTDEKAIRRMRAPLHTTKVESLEAALRLLGRAVEVTVSERAAA